MLIKYSIIDMNIELEKQYNFGGNRRMLNSNFVGTGVDTLHNYLLQNKNIEDGLYMNNNNAGFEYNENVKSEKHYYDWNDKFGKNFTDNNGIHNNRMFQKNIETGGGYQAAVSGMYGEFTIAAILKSLPDEYHVMNDIILQQGTKLRPYKPEIYGQSPFKVIRKGNRYFEVVKKSTQLDHLVVSPYGLFVIETKNHKGWVFGDVNGKVWTQTLNGMNGTGAYGGHSHFKFYNPVKQNQTHMNEIAKQIRVPMNCMTGMIVFTNPEAFLGNVNCNCCYTLDMVYEAIMSYTRQIWSEKNTIKIIKTVEKMDANSYTVAKEHEAYVKDIKRRADINKMLKSRR